MGNDVVVTGGVIGKGTHQNTLSAGKKEFYKYPILKNRGIPALSDVGIFFA